MKVQCRDIAKRFLYDYVFKSINLEINSGSRIGIQGPNGSGKSTFLKIIMGYLSPSHGSVEYFLDNSSVEREFVFRHLSLAAPYVGLIDEFSLEEHLKFHQNHKAFYSPLDVKGFQRELEFDFDPSQRIQYYSSGMSHRVKLGLAILSNSDLLVLDEPTSFLDDDGKVWFHKFLNKYAFNRTIVIASNDEEDFRICSQRENLLNWK